MHGRVTLCLIAAALGIVLASPAVMAEGTGPGSGGSGSTGIDCAPLATQCTVSAGSSGSPGGSGSGVAPRRSRAPAGPADPVPLNLLELIVYGTQTSSSEAPDFYIVTCTPVLDDEVGEWLAEVWPQPPAEPTPGQVAQTAEADLNLPAPTVSTAPSGGKAIVSLESWLWIDPADWTPIQATATAGGITATATARAVAVVWDMGDGNNPVTCNGPGVAYNTNIPDADQSTTCGYTYQETSGNAPHQQFTITTYIVYDVSWTSVGVAGGGDLGDIAGQSTTTPVTVDEIGTVIVPNP